jgi:hypothetical protein
MTLTYFDWCWIAVYFLGRTVPWLAPEVKSPVSGF